MTVVYILRNFNNYYNRQVKKFDTIDEYIAAVGEQNVAIRGTDRLPGLETGGIINFSINDGINTTLTYNYDPSQEWQPDYIVVTDENGDILHRWFVLEATRTRKGQYHMTLRRDVIVDNFNALSTAPVYITKAMLTDDDPFIYNKEGLTFNQIKKSETLLRDKTGCGWIVGYVSRQPGKSTETLNVTSNGYFDFTKKNIDRTAWYPYTYAQAPLDEWDTPSPSRLFKNDYLTGTAIKIRVELLNDETYTGTVCDIKFTYNGSKFTYDSYTVVASYYYGSIPGTSGHAYYMYVGNAAISTWISGIASQYRTFLNTATIYNDSKNLSANEQSYSANKYPPEGTVGTEQYILGTKILSSAEYSSMLSYDDQILKTTDDGKYYEIGIDRATKPVLNDVEVDNTSDFATSVIACLRRANNILGRTYTIGTNTTPVLFKYTRYATAARMGFYGAAGSGSAVAHLTDAISLVDAPYKMFAIPYDPLNRSSLALVKNGTAHRVDYSLGMAVAQQLSAVGGGENGYLYDLQLLPYCPFADRNFVAEHSITTTDLVADRDIDYIYDNRNEIASAIFWCTYSNFTLNISHTIAITNKKIQNQTDMWRLCAPDYNGAFEFNAALNNGTTYFNVDCTYKPYQPYIHVNPDFKNLYGSDFEDARGLICSGNFSLPQTTSAWATYVRNNVNYQNSFDRSITNLELTQDIQMKQMKWSMGAGVLQGAVSGAAAGAAGGVPGMIAGAAVGGAASGVGGAMDIKYQKQLNAEAIDYAQTTFEYQKGNIKAIPNSLSKVSSFVYNNKIYPFIEYYSCTETETEAFIELLKYQGMTVNRMGTIAEMISNGMYSDDYRFISGQVIRLEGSDDDYHNLNEINNELNKGVYIKYDTE